MFKNLLKIRRGRRGRGIDSWKIRAYGCWQYCRKNQSLWQTYPTIQILEWISQQNCHDLSQFGICWLIIWIVEICSRQLVFALCSPIMNNATLGSRVNLLNNKVTIVNWCDHIVCVVLLLHANISIDQSLLLFGRVQGQWSSECCGWSKNKEKPRPVVWMLKWVIRFIHKNLSKLTILILRKHNEILTMLRCLEKVSKPNWSHHIL